MICNKHLSCSKGRIRDLKRHGETEVHRKRARSCEGQKNLHSTWSETETIARRAARAEAILSHMLVEHNIPFLLMDHLPAVISHAFPDSKIAREVKCARTKTTCIVKHALGPAAHENMTVGVMTSPAFSLLMDESTDRGDVKRVGLLTVTMTNYLFKLPQASWVFMMFRMPMLLTALSALISN